MPRGRKKKKNYFGEEQEKAVVRFLECESEEERTKIYNQDLREPLIKMGESIIRTYKLYREGYDFQTLLDDTLSYLLTKVHKFEPSRNKKAYSYFGTICKNYLINEIKKDNKQIVNFLPYSDYSTTIETRPDMIYFIENEEIDREEVLSIYVNKLRVFMDENDLNNNEIKLGYGLIELFEKYNDIFIVEVDNKKYHKNMILNLLREMTNMSTKEIRGSIKKFKNLYYDLINKLYK